MENTNIKPLYQALIYIEENESVKADFFGRWGKSASRGIIGKMEAMGLVARVEKDSATYFRLSDEGYRYINSTLDSLHEEVLHWDNKWTLVWFSIPENNRKFRDKFRRYLESLGLKPVLNSLWITPLNLKDSILKYAIDNKIISNVAVVYTENISGLTNDSILSTWDFSRTRCDLEAFIEEGQIFIQNSQNSSRINCKLMIFRYALILNSEPKLPIELFPSDWPRYRADQIYKKIRNLIN